MESIQPEVKKKRVRKKTCEIDSLEKLKSDTKKNKDVKDVKDTKDTKDKDSKKVVKKTVIKDEKNELNQSQISFGKFSITVKKKESMTAEELRNYYDTKFKIEDSEKTAKLMVQEDDINTVFEPIMENETVLKSNFKSTERSSEPKIVKAKIERTNVHKVLSKFINDSKTCWPEKTDVWCWWCCHPFDTMPIPCPIEYDEIRNIYKVNGIFCSWSCAAAYSVKEYSSLSLIYQMKNKLCGYSENITVSPPRQCLKNFGGYMPITSYRALDKTKTFLISTEDLSYVNQEICELKM